MAKTLCDVLEHNARTTNKGITFILNEYKEDRMTYEQLYVKAAAVLDVLQKSGVKNGNELILYFTDNALFMCSFWACMLGGIIAVPVSVGISEGHKRKLYNIWKTLNNPYIITDESSLQMLIKEDESTAPSPVHQEIRRKAIVFPRETPTGQGELAAPFPDDIAFIQFSSGSTGNPKGVILSHKNLLANMHAISNGTAITLDDNCLNWMPLTHDFGLIGQHLTMIMAGLDQYHMPSSLFIRRPGLWMEKASQHKSSILSSPNFGYRYLLSKINHLKTEGLDLSSVRAIYNGAEPISIRLCKKFLDAMAPFGMKRSALFNVYGLAEATLAVAFPQVEEVFSYVVVNRNHLSVGDRIVAVDNENKSEAISFADVGYPVKNCNFRICDDADRQVEELIVGHIQISGDIMSRGYYNNEEETRKIFTEDGWLRTGDTGFIKNRRLIVVGRVKEIIFINGLNYYPHDIEGMIGEIKSYSFREVAVCGIQSQREKMDEIVVFVLHRGEMKEFIPIIAAIKKHVSRTAGVEIQVVVPVKAIPKTTSGKIQRYQLAQQYARGDYDGLLQQINLLAGREAGNVEDRIDAVRIEMMIKKICADILNVTQPRGGDNIIEIGGNSINLIQIYQKLEEAFPGRVTVASMLACQTISKLAECIAMGEPAV